MTTIAVGPRAAEAAEIRTVTRTLGEGYMVRVPGPEWQLLSRRRLVQYVNLGVYDLLQPLFPARFADARKRFIAPRRGGAASLPRSFPDHPVGERGGPGGFGYGSLMWRPGFDFVERHVGTLHGWRRRLCVYSHVHRGTPDRPGLVLGLDRGGACRGVTVRGAAEKRAPAIAYLRERELVTHVYREIMAGVRLDDGRRVTALTYVCDPRHPQFAGRLDHDALMHFIRQGRGISRDNRDYVCNTAAHLRELGVEDAVLARLARELE